MTETLSAVAAVPLGLLEALQRSELFRALAPEELRALAEASALRSMRRGDKMWQEGAPSAHVGIVAAGRVKCWSPGREARQWVNNVVRPGGTCGLAACVEGGPYMCNAEPIERSRVALVPSRVLRELMARSPAFTTHVAEALAREVRRVLDLCEDVTLRTPVERLAHFLQMRAGAADVLELAETQTQIAAQIGTVREVVGRGLRTLEARGIIVRRGRTIRVLDAQSLDALAGGRAR